MCFHVMHFAIHVSIISVYLFVYLVSIYLPTYLSVYLLPVRLSIYTSISLSLSLSPAVSAGRRGVTEFTYVGATEALEERQDLEACGWRLAEGFAQSSELLSEACDLEGSGAVEARGRDFESCLFCRCSGSCRQGMSILERCLRGLKSEQALGGVQVNSVTKIV